MKNLSFYMFELSLFNFFKENKNDISIYHKNKPFSIVSAYWDNSTKDNLTIELRNSTNKSARITLPKSTLKEWWHETNYITQLYTKEIEEKGEYKPELLEKAYNDFIYTSLERIVNLMGVFSHDD